MRNHEMNIWITIARRAAIFITILLLTACGGSGGEGDSSGTSTIQGQGEIGNKGGSGETTYNYGFAALSWLPPTENTDGSALTNLAGYRIYYGTEIGNYTNTVNIDNPGVATYLIDNLDPGNTYYFVITAITSDGLESEYSSMGSKTIPA